MTLDRGLRKEGAGPGILVSRVQIVLMVMKVTIMAGMTIPIVVVSIGGGEELPIVNATTAVVVGTQMIMVVVNVMKGEAIPIPPMVIDVLNVGDQAIDSEIVQMLDVLSVMSKVIPLKTVTEMIDVIEMLNMINMIDMKGLTGVLVEVLAEVQVTILVRLYIMLVIDYMAGKIMIIVLNGI